MAAAATFQVVVAVDWRTRGIGAGGRLAWYVPEDMAYFAQLTTETRDLKRQNAVVMGRRTYESISELCRPLQRRHNVVMSRTGAYRSLDAALDGAAALGAETVFVAGGEGVYREALASPRCVAVHVTELDVANPAAYDCFFPALDPAVFALWSADPEPRKSRKQGAWFRRLTFVRRKAMPLALPMASPPHPERAVADLVREGGPVVGAHVRLSLRDRMVPMLGRVVASDVLATLRSRLDAPQAAAVLRRVREDPANPDNVCEWDGWVAQFVVARGELSVLLSARAWDVGSATFAFVVATTALFAHAVAAAATLGAGDLGVSVGLAEANAEGRDDALCLVPRVRSLPARATLAEYEAADFDVE